MSAGNANRPCLDKSTLLYNRIDISYPINLGLLLVDLCLVIMPPYKTLMNNELSLSSTGGNERA